MNAVRSWNSEGSTDASMFFYKEADGNFSDHYTQGGKGGFWIQGNGMVGEWPNVVFYNTIGWDSENDLFTISIGQFPDSLSAGATFNPQFKLVLGEKEATFDITYIVKPIPEVAAPTTLVEKDLNVVGETTLEVKQFPRSGTNGTTYEFEIEDLLEKLEMPSSELLSLVLSKIIYSPERDPAIGDKKDTLTNNSTASAPGWWLAKQTEDEHGNISDEVLAAPYNTDGEVYYTEQFKFEDNKLSFVLGQHGNALKAGDSYYNNVYIIYNDKAYRIRIQLTIEEADYSGLDDMTKTGETIIEKEQGIDDSYNYYTVSFTLDTDAIAAELGCEKNQLSLQVLDANNNLTSSGTANNGGFWMTADGVACGWGNSAIVFVEPVTAGDLSTLKIGHYPGNLKVGDEVRFNMYIVNEGKYHLLDILYKVKDKEAEDQSGYKIVATRNAVVQVIAHATEYIVNDYTGAEVAKFAAGAKNFNFNGLNFNLENFNLDSILENTPTHFFNLATATNDNVLNTIGKAIAAIDNYNNGAITRSDADNILSQTQVSIRNTQLSVNTTMTSIGARQNTLDNIINANCEISDVKKEAKATISEVDLYEVTTDLTKTQTYLQMAMTSFNYVTGTSLFDYIH